MASTTLAFDIIAKDRASKAFDQVGDSANKSSGRMKAWAKVGGLAVAGAAVVAGKALFDMAKAAAEDEKSQARLATALRNTAGATDKQVAGVEDWITAQGKALGVADDQLRPALARLATATGDVGKAQKLTSLAMDISAGSGKSLDTVSTALAKAQNGQVAGLARLGVKTKDAEGKTRSLNDITKDLAKTYSGQASAAADTTAGKWGRLSLRFDEAKETLGAKLLPIGEKVADWLLNDLGPASEKAGKWFKENILPPMREFGEKVAPKVRDLIDKVKGGLKDAQPWFELLGKVFKNVIGPALTWVATTVLTNLGRQMAVLGKAVGIAGEAGIWLWNKAFAPTIRFLLRGFATVTEGWAIVLRGLSKVPGFGWARKAADSMENAARKARGLADNIKGIPGHKDVRITVGVSGQDALNTLLRVTRGGAGSSTPAGPILGHATGTTFWRGGPTRLHEQGPEIIDLPNGSRVIPAGLSRQMTQGTDENALYRAVRRALSEMPILRMPDAGQGAYLRGSSF